LNGLYTSCDNPLIYQTGPSPFGMQTDQPPKSALTLPSNTHVSDTADTLKILRGRAFDHLPASTIDCCSHRDPAATRGLVHASSSTRKKNLLQHEGRVKLKAPLVVLGGCFQLQA